MAPYNCHQPGRNHGPVVINCVGTNLVITVHIALVSVESCLFLVPMFCFSVKILEKLLYYDSAHKPKEQRMVRKPRKDSKI